MRYFYLFLGTVIILVLFLLLIAVIRALLLKPTKAQVVERKDGDKETSGEYAKTLSELIQCETVSSRSNNDTTKFYKFHELLAKKFPNIYEKCEKKDFNGSLLFKWKGNGEGKPILLMSHMDVVEASGKWTHPPFSGEIVDDVVWGRGSVDTKSSLFCILQAAEELIRDGYVPNCDVYIGSSCTEEIGGKGAPSTAEYLKEQGVKLGLLIDEGGVIMHEPLSGVNGRYAMVGILEKGYGDLKFIAKSGGGHASAPPKKTAIGTLAKFISQVEKKSPFRCEISEPVRIMYEKLAPNCSFPLKLIFGNLWLFGPILKKLMPSINSTGAAMLKTTIAFTMQKGSDGTNVLPTEAHVVANMRYIPHQSTDESNDIISNIAKKYGIETEVIYKGYPTKTTDTQGEAYKTVERTINKVFPNVEVSPYIMTGGTDARFYNDVCDNCIRFAPIEINKQQFLSIHAKDENISSLVLPPAVEFYKEIIKNTNLS